MGKTKNKKEMQTEESAPKHLRVKDVSVDMFTQFEDVKNRILRGRALFNPDNDLFMFAENAPRGPRSRQVYRDKHVRMVQRPDGTFTATFHFVPSEGVFGDMCGELFRCYRAAKGRLKEYQEMTKEGMDGILP